MPKKTYDVKGLSAWAIKRMYKEAHKSGYLSDVRAMEPSFVEIVEDERDQGPIIAQCCGCSCEKCSHQGGNNRHTPTCIARFFNEQSKFKISS